MFRGSVKGTGYPLHSPFSPSLPLPCVTVYHHISNGVNSRTPFLMDRPLLFGKSGSQRLGRYLKGYGMRARWRGPSTGGGIDTTNICESVFITCTTVTVPDTDVRPADVLAIGILHCHLVPQNRSWLRTQLSSFPSPFPTSSPRKFQNKLTGRWLFILSQRVPSQRCQGRLLITNLAVEAAPQNLLHVLRRSSEPSAYINPTLLTWTIWWALNNASKWLMGFNSAFKGLNMKEPGSYVSESSVTIPDVPPLPTCTTLNIQPIPVLNHRLTDNFFRSLPLTHQPFT